MRALFVFAMLVSCEPKPLVQTAPAPSTLLAVEDPPADDCRRDIPDCSAACALRATNHLEFIDWYDRRCAAVILGKNPDKVAGLAPAEGDAGNRVGVPVRGNSDDLLANPYR